MLGGEEGGDGAAGEGGGTEAEWRRGGWKGGWRYLYWEGGRRETHAVPAHGADQVHLGESCKLG